jgi:hypothetical protein
MLVEIKAAEAQDAVAAELERAGARDQVVLASFQHRAMEKLRDGRFWSVRITAT